MGELDEPGLGLPLHLLPGLDTALRSMRAGERAFFSLAAAAAAEGPEGAFGGPQHAEAQEAVHELELGWGGTVDWGEFEDWFWRQPSSKRQLLYDDLVPRSGPARGV